MPGSGEGRAIADFEQDASSGPDSHAGHEGQDPGKRVCIEHLLDLFLDGSALFEQLDELGGEFGQDEFGGFRARHRDGLLAQRGLDLIDDRGVHARGARLGDRDQATRPRCP